MTKLTTKKERERELRNKRICDSFRRMREAEPTVANNRIINAIAVETKLEAFSVYRILKKYEVI